MTLPCGPTDQPDQADTSRTSRATAMVGKALVGTGEHRYTEWAFALMGVGLLVADAHSV
jgi:hypothetical protein